MRTTYSVPMISTWMLLLCIWMLYMPHCSIAWRVKAVFTKTMQRCGPRNGIIASTSSDFNSASHSKFISRSKIYMISDSDSDRNDGDKDSAPVNIVEELKAMPLDDIMEKLAKLPESELQELPQEVKDLVQKKIDEEGPNVFQRAAMVLGLTPLTIAGFLLAFVLIGLNNIFGNGWASRLLGINDTFDMTSPESKTFRQRQDLEDPNNKELINQYRGDMQYNIDDIIDKVKELREKDATVVE